MCSYNTSCCVYQLCSICDTLGYAAVLWQKEASANSAVLRKMRKTFVAQLSRFTKGRTNLVTLVNVILEYKCNVYA